MAFWAGTDPLWGQLDGTQRAAAMSLLEARAGDLQGARNVLGAIINRAGKDGKPLSEAVSSRIYQPTIEESQRQRLPQVIQSPAFQQLVDLAKGRLEGKVPDWVGGATHFLAPPNTMLALEEREPDKYKSWRSWTGYDPETNSYANTVMADSSHVFLTPDGRGGASKMPPADKEKPMFNLAAILSGYNGGGFPGMAATAMGGTPKLPSAADPGAFEKLFGSLGAFGGDMGGAGGSAGGGGDGLKLAQQAQQSASGEDAGSQLPSARAPVNMQNLLQMLQKSGQLGVPQMRRLGTA